MKLIETVFTSKMYYRLCSLLLFFVAAAASFHGYYESHHLYDVSNGSIRGAGTFEPEIDGTDERPFVYRQLLPAIANWIDARVPEQTKEKLFNLKGRSGLLFRERIIDSPIAQDRTYFLRYWIVYATVFLFAWVSVFASYSVGKAADFPPAASALAAVALILVIPYVQSGLGHYYDYPELAFLMLAVWMAIKIDWWWLLPVAALATWNKESFLLFIPALYPLFRMRNSRIRALTGIGFIALTSGAVYFALRLRFQNNPGGTVDFNLMAQIHYLSVVFDPRRMVMVRTYGVWAPAAESLPLIALIVWTVWRAWRRFPLAIRRHIQIAAIINFPLFMLFGWGGELRALSMLYPALLFLLSANLTEWMNGNSKAVTPQ